MREDALDFIARVLVHTILWKGTVEDLDKFCAMMIVEKLAGRAVLKIAS
jgi:propanol-preferring alcohol dehydrogenase